MLNPEYVGRAVGLRIVDTTLAELTVRGSNTRVDDGLILFGMAFAGSWCFLEVTSSVRCVNCCALGGILGRKGGSRFCFLRISPLRISQLEEKGMHILG